MDLQQLANFQRSATVVRRGAQQLVASFTDFQRSHYVFPQLPNSTLKREGVASGYCLVIRGCRVRVPQALAVPGAVPRGGGLALRFRVSLFDFSAGSFFGSTYASARALALTDRGAGLVETEDAEVLYLVSSIKDDNAATIVEAVLVVHDASGVVLQVWKSWHGIPGFPYDFKPCLSHAGDRSGLVSTEPAGASEASD